MKKVFIFLFFVVTIPVYGQEEISSDVFIPLKNIHRINVEVDWSSSLINDLDQEEWIEIRQNELRKYDARIELEKQLKPQLFSCGIPHANSQLIKYNLKFVRYQETPITLCLTPININHKTGKWECDFKFQYSESKEVFAQFRLNGKGISLGGLQTKWEYIFENVGDEFGKLIYRKLKEVYKK